MKLLDKYNRISLLTTVVVMIITGIVYYYTISAILTNQIDKNLVVEENEIFNYVSLNHKLPQVFTSTDQQISFTPVSKIPITRQFINENFYNSKGKDNESGRGLISSVAVNHKIYQIQIIESKVETEDLIRIIFLITLGVIILLILTLFIINRLVIKKLWQPFYQTLHQIKLFNLTDRNSMVHVHAEIEEFNELNSAVTIMALRVKSDYQELKNFMENAAHELLTPIAVINSKMDILIQTENFNQRQSELLNDVYETVSKLTRLNKSMLLLTKIENKLIYDNQSLNLKEHIELAISQFHELFSNKDITVTSNLKDVPLNISKSLFDILLNNLLSNAVRHNIRGGRVEVFLDHTGLIIKNTGKDSALDVTQIFQRFNKAPESEGSGLGLTLTRQICENYYLNLSYAYVTPFHAFKVAFSYR